MSLPSISIITACYNCGRYIEETVRSVTGQRSGANVKYIVIDGDSTDNTLDVLKSCKNRVDILISEPDKGMYYGIDKGAAFADTEIMAWLNADDIYYPWTLSVVAQIFKQFPHVDWIIGQPSYINEQGQCIKVSSNAGTAYPQNYIQKGWFQPAIAGYLQQESMFWRKRLWDKAGGLDLQYRFAADFELWTRFARHAELYSVSVPLACFRKRPDQTSAVSARPYSQEVEAVCRKLGTFPNVRSYINTKNQLLRILSRLGLWKTGRVIAYSESRNQWVEKKMVRPLSRYSFSEVLMEWCLRK